MSSKRQHHSDPYGMNEEDYDRGPRRQKTTAEYSQSLQSTAPPLRNLTLPRMPGMDDPILEPSASYYSNHSQGYPASQGSYLPPGNSIYQPRTGQQTMQNPSSGYVYDTHYRPLAQEYEGSSASSYRGTYPGSFPSNEHGYRDQRGSTYPVQQSGEYSSRREHQSRDHRAGPYNESGLEYHPRHDPPPRGRVQLSINIESHPTPGRTTSILSNSGRHESTGQQDNTYKNYQRSIAKERLEYYKELILRGEPVKRTTWGRLRGQLKVHILEGDLVDGDLEEFPKGKMEFFKEKDLR